MRLHTAISAFLLTCLVVVLSSTAMAADSWDPGDDTRAGATLLESLVPKVTRTHGPHSCGNEDSADWYQIYLVARATYFFSSEGGSGDTIGELYDATGQTPLVSNDDLGDDFMFSLTYRPDVSGTYYLKVRPFGSLASSYTLSYWSDGCPDSWDPADDTTAGATMLPEPTSAIQWHEGHSLGHEDRVDWFRVYLRGFANYTFSAVRNGAFGLGFGGVEVFDDTGSWELPRKWSGDYYSVSLIAPRSGYYRVKVTSDAYYPAGYDLQYLGSALEGGDLELVSAVFSPSSPAYVAPGELLGCKWEIDGSSTVGNRFFCELFASKNGGFDLERLGGTVTNSYSLAHAGGATIVNPGNQYVNTIPDGLYTLVAVINRPSVNAIEETTYTNNLAPIAGGRLLVHNPNPAVCDLAWQGDVAITREASTVSMNGVLTNAGAAASPAYGFWVETVYGHLTPEGLFEQVGYVAGGDRVGSVAPGASVNYTKQGTLPEGEWAVAVIVDSTDLVPETNEANNYVVQGTIPSSSGELDLEIVSAGIGQEQLAPNELSSSGTLNWSCTVRNHSSVDSGPVWFELFASTRGGLEILRAGTSLTSSEMRSLGAGETQTFTFSQALNPIADGIYSVVAVVNRQGTGGVAESQRANNRYVLPGRIFLHNDTFAGANLVWASGPTLERNGNQVTVRGSISNSGTTSSGAFWTEIFYGFFDGDGFFSKAGTLSPGFYSAGVDAGASVDYAQTRTLRAGNYVLGVLIDSTDIVPETDETDNYDYLVP